MDHCLHQGDAGDPRTGDEHPVIAWLALVAIAAAMLLIAWARIEVLGTEDIEAALTDEPAATVPAGDQQRDEAEKAAAASRWATGFSP